MLTQFFWFANRSTLSVLFSYNFKGKASTETIAWSSLCVQGRSEEYKTRNALHKQSKSMATNKLVFVRSNYGSKRRAREKEHRRLFIDTVPRPKRESIILLSCFGFSHSKISIVMIRFLLSHHTCHILSKQCAFVDNEDDVEVDFNTWITPKKKYC